MSTPPQPRVSSLGINLLFAGLAGVLGSIAAQLVTTNLESPVLVVPGLVALGGAAYLGYSAYTAYQKNGGVQWWQLGAPVFAAMLAFAFFYAATDVDVFGVPLVLGRLGGLLTIVVGGIIATVQASKQPSATPSGALVAPVVGYTAEGQPVYGAPVSAQSTNVCAILALVFGLLGGLLGVVFGHIALSQINRTGENGRGLAVAGLALGYLAVTLWSLFLVVALSAAIT